MDAQKAPWLAVDDNGQEGQIMVGDQPFRPVYQALWDADYRLKEMDAQGVGLQIVCATPVMFGYTWDAGKAADWAAGIGDVTGELMSASQCLARPNRPCGRKIRITTMIA